MNRVLDILERMLGILERETEYEDDPDPDEDEDLDEEVEAKVVAIGGKK